VAGSGTTHRLDGVAVIAACDFLPGDDPLARDIQDGVIDMAGSGAIYTPWSHTINVVLTFARDAAAPLAEVDAAIRRVTLRIARDMAATTVGGGSPDDMELLGVPQAGEDLPRVCVILQLGSQGPLYDTYLYGASVDGMLPTLLAPTEVLDGAITSGAYHWAALRNPTHCFQRSSLLIELLRAHGNRVHFQGVVATRAYSMGADEKWRSALLAAKLARQIGAEGAILTTDGGGNSHTDTMLTCRACEQMEVRSTVIVAEMGGLTDRVAEADAIVCTGNADELVPQWRPERVIGGDVLVGGRSAYDAGDVPVRNYMAATNQKGQMSLKGVSW
jgi:glycine reductase